MKWRLLVSDFSKPSFSTALENRSPAAVAAFRLLAHEWVNGISVFQYHEFARASSWPSSTLLGRRDTWSRCNKR